MKGIKLREGLLFPILIAFLLFSMVAVISVGSASISQVLRRRGQSRYLNLSKANKEYFFKSGGPELKKDIKKAEV